MNSLNTSTQGWQRPLWLALLIAASVGFTLGLACAAPLAAFSAVAALTLPRRDAFFLSAGVWLANQAVGFLCLSYPIDANCLAWGAVLGVTALLSTLAAQQALRLVLVNSLLRGAAAFLAAFAVYEGVLYGAALVLGGADAFTLTTQGGIFVLNGLALVGLLLLHRAGAALRIAPPYRAAHA